MQATVWNVVVGVWNVILCTHFNMRHNGCLSELISNIWFLESGQTWGVNTQEVAITDWFLVSTTIYWIIYSGNWRIVRLKPFCSFWYRFEQLQSAVISEATYSILGALSDWLGWIDFPALEIFLYPASIFSHINSMHGRFWSHQWSWRYEKLKLEEEIL